MKGGSEVSKEVLRNIITRKGGIAYIIQEIAQATEGQDKKVNLSHELALTRPVIARGGEVLAQPLE